MFYKNQHLKLKTETDIQQQIKEAFCKKPNIASAIHGQRKIYQGSFGRRTSLFPSQKCGGAIPLESRLELAHAICLERDTNTFKYRTQALKITLSSKNFIYPDFLVLTKENQYEVHEVKPLIASLALNDLDRYAKLSDILNSINIKFRLVDQTELPKETEISQLLYWYQRGHRFSWNAFEVEYAQEKLRNIEYKGSTQIYKILESIGLRQELGDYLLFHKKIKLISQTIDKSKGEI